MVPIVFISVCSQVAKSHLSPPPLSCLPVGTNDYDCMPNALQEPVLWTSTRSRPTHFKPREDELLEEDRKELQRAFHAKPVE